MKRMGSEWNGFNITLILTNGKGRMKMEIVNKEE